MKGTQALVLECFNKAGDAVMRFVENGKNKIVKITIPADTSFTHVKVAFSKIVTGNAP